MLTRHLGSIRTCLFKPKDQPVTGSEPNSSVPERSRRAAWFSCGLVNGSKNRTPSHTYLNSLNMPPLPEPVSSMRKAPYPKQNSALVSACPRKNGVANLHRKAGTNGVVVGTSPGLKTDG